MIILQVAAERPISGKLGVKEQIAFACPLGMLDVGDMVAVAWQVMQDER